MTKKGLIVKSLGGFYYVKCNDELITCRAKGGFRNSNETPFVGDTVDIRIVPGELEEGYVEKIYPRKNSVARPPVTNIDRMIIVSSVASPAPDTTFIDKMTVICEHSKITPILCFNKTDLNKSDYIISEYEKTGYRIVCTSAIEKLGTGELKKLVSEGITAVAGFSGVGKSSLLNEISGETLSETGKVSKKLSRGKHTTRHAELFEISKNAYIADTPGFSGLSIDLIRKEELADLFPEFRSFLGECRFNDCVHIGECDCAVKKAAENGQIAPFRYENYKAFYETIKNINEWDR